MKKVLVIVGCWILASWSLIGQQVEPFIHHLTVEDGLSQRTNEFIYKDSLGFIWLSSISGLNRYDGRSVKVYQPDSEQPNSLFGQNIQSSFFEHDNGDLWFTTYEGLNRYVRAHDHFEHFLIPDSVAGKANGYYAFHLDGEGYLWLIISNLEVCKFHIPSRTWTKVLSLQHDANRATALTDENGMVKKIWSFNFQTLGLEEAAFGKKGTARQLLFSEGTPAFEISKVLPNGQSNVWLATSNGLYDYDHITGTITPTPAFANTFVNAVAPFGTDSLILALNDSGLVIFNKKTGTIDGKIKPANRNLHSLSSDNIDQIYTDRDGGTWLTIPDRGVDFFFPKKQKFRSIKLTDESGLPLGVNSFLEGENGQIWCGTFSSGIYVVNQRGQVVDAMRHQRNNPHSLPSDAIIYLFKEKNGRIWALTWEGLAFWVPGKNHFQRVPTDGLEFPYMYQLQDGRLLLSCYGKGIYEMLENPDGSFSIKKIDTIDDSGAFTTLWQNAKGELFACREVTSIHVMLPDENFRLVRELEIPGESDAFFEDPANGDIWIANSYGLIRLDPKAGKHEIFDEKSGLPDQVVYGLLPDDSGKLWLSTNRGLAAFDLQTHEARSFNLADGLSSYDFSKLAFLQQKDGQLWFGSSQGITRFYPKNVKDLEVTATPVITNILIDDQEAKGLTCTKTNATNVSEIESLSLSWSENTLSFSFAALEYSDPAYTRFRYKFDGVDEKWVESEIKNFVRYANLPSGDLTFRVMASNSDNVWSEERPLEVHIRPPYWQRWWFYVLVALAAFGTGWYIAWNRRKRREKLAQMEREKREALDKQRQRIARDVHDDLGSGLSALSLLTEMAKYRSDDQLRSEIDKINLSARDLSGKIREVIWTVSAKNDALANLISYLQQYTLDLTENAGLECRFNLPEEIPEVTINGEHRRTTFLAFKEALNNITKHAEATEVDIDISAENELAKISVKDNGKGFDPKLLLDSTGNGLLNMRSRMQDIGGDCDFKTDKNGTQVVFSLPLNPA